MLTTTALLPGIIRGLTTADDRDQGYHKDNTFQPVRDPWSRQISMFYYPGPVAVDLDGAGTSDGATCFLPGTHYLGLDRAGLGCGPSSNSLFHFHSDRSHPTQRLLPWRRQGEERLDKHMMPAVDKDWLTAISNFTDSKPNPYKETDERREHGLPLLGLAGLKETPMTHQGGVVVIWHNDIFHRRSRQRQPSLQTYEAPQGLDYRLVSHIFNR